MPEIFERLVAIDTDDVRYNGTTFGLTGLVLRMGNVSGISWQVACRWVNIAIPKNANIASACVSFNNAESQSGTACNISVLAEAEDNPATFSDITNYLARNRTPTPVNWNNIEAWPTVEIRYSSCELKTLIQEIVNRDGWTSGNALVLFFTNSASSTNARRLGGHCAPDGTSSAAILHIEYAAPMTCATGVFTLTGKPATFTVRRKSQRSNLFAFLMWNFLKRKGKL